MHRLSTRAEEIVSADRCAPVKALIQAQEVHDASVLRMLEISHVSLARGISTS